MSNPHGCCDDCTVTVRIKNNFKFEKLPKKDTELGDKVCFIYIGDEGKEREYINLDIKTDDFGPTAKDHHHKIYNGKCKSFTVEVTDPKQLKVKRKSSNGATNNEGTIVVEDVGDDPDCDS